MDLSHIYSQPILWIASIWQWFKDSHYFLFDKSPWQNKTITSKYILCDVPHRIWENVPDAIYVEAHFHQVDAF